MTKNIQTTVYFSGYDNHREGSAARQEHDRRRHCQERRRQQLIIRLPPKTALFSVRVDGCP